MTLSTTGGNECLIWETDSNGEVAKDENKEDAWATKRKERKMRKTGRTS